MGSVVWQAWRSWKNAKAIALLATVAFAVGIGSTTAIYTVVNAVMLRPLPYAESDRFVALYSARPNEPGQYGANSIEDLREYERRATSFDVFGWFRPQTLNLTAPGEPRHIQAASVTPSLAQHLGVSPIVGRWFADESGVVISNRLWRQLGSGADIVGQGVTINGRRLTITGVMGPGFQLPLTGPGTEGFESDVWVYLDPLGKGLNPGEGYYFAYARRKPGVSLAQAEADVKRVAVEIAAMAPASHPSYTARLDDLRDTTIREIRPTLLLLFGAAGLLLLITCANVAGLLLARSVARARETATRVALGASHRQLALHYLIEGFLVSLAGAAAGVVVSVGLVRLVISIGSEFVPKAREIAIDWTVIAFALAMALLTSILSSLAPLWQALRTAPNEVLTAGVRASAGARVRKLSQSLVVAEIALAFTLLAVGAVLIGHLRNLARTSAGFDTDHLHTFSVTMPESIAAKDETRVPYQRRLTEALEAIPGVTGAGFTNQLPLNGCCLATTIYREGSGAGSNIAERTAFIISDPGFLRTLKVPLRSGRFLTAADTTGDPLNVLINQAAARRYWPDRNPLDASARLGGPKGSRFRVVGVVGDIRNDGLGKPTVPEVYLSSMVAAANPLDFVVRSPLPADQLLAAARRAIRTVDPTLPIHDASTMADIVHDSMVLERVGSLMTTFFALAALLMATLGVYGIVSYAVRQRTVELGTRMALGAVGRDLLALVIGGGLRMAAYGVAVGAVAVAAAAWLLVRSFNVHDIGWIPFASSTAIVASLAAAASSFPGWRATRLSPMVAIRDESESLWHSARASLRRAVREISKAVSSGDAVPAISEADLLAEFVTATRRAESSSDAVRIALGTLRNRLGADSALLLERLTTGGYGCTSAAPASIAFTLPADGFLLHRLEAFPFPLPLSDGYFETLARWAEEQRPERLAEIRALQSIGARMAVGLRTKNEILGVLLLGPAVNREAYSEPERNVLRSCAAQFALMVENGRLTSRIVEQEKLRRDLALAAEVQKRLLPEHPPEISLAALSAVSLPARAVGGDYYDFIDVGNKQVGIALADISGKGVAAALIMSAVQASLRILSSEPNISLPQLAAKMNDFLHRSTPANKYATFFYAQVDEGRRQLRYVNAGHLPPYLLRRAVEPSSEQSGVPAHILELSSGGAVIGLMPDMTYEEATIDLQSGDVLVAFTDGVTEAMNAQDEEFGEERLKDLLREIVHLPVGEISSRISATLRDWIQNVDQYDDVTFIVLKVNQTSAG